MFSNIGFTELIIIMLIILLLFGPKKIPELAQSIGKGIKEFKRAISDAKDKIENPNDDNKDDKKSNN